MMRWGVVRAIRILLISVVLFWLVGIAQTTPYLGLPLEPKPIFLDCYDQAIWNGKVFVPTGKVICLGED